MAQWLSNNGATSTPVSAGYTLGTKIKVSSDRSPSKIGFKLAARASTIKVSLWDRSTGTRVWTSSPSSVSDGWTWFTVSGITLIADREYSLSAYVVTTNIDWYEATQDGATWFSSTIEGATYSHQGGYDYAAGDTYPNTAVHSGNTSTFTVGLEVGQSLTHSAGDTLALSDQGVAGFLREHSLADSLGVLDSQGGKAISKSLGSDIPALFGTARFGLSRFDAVDVQYEQVALSDEATASIVILHSAADPLALTDATSRAVTRGAHADAVSLADELAKQPRPSTAEAATAITDSLVQQAQKAITDTLSLVDAITGAAVSLAKADTTGVTESLSASVVLSAFADTLSLTDSLAKLVTLATQADSMTLSDVVAKAIQRGAAADTLSLADALTSRPVLSPADVAALADVISKAIATLHSDTASVAEAVAFATGLSTADALSLVDQVALAVARGTQADAVSLADELVGLIATLSTADSFGSNLAPPFSAWTLTGSAYVDAAGVLHLPVYGARALSPLMPTGRAANWGVSAEFYSDDARPGFADAGYLQGSEYFNFQGALAKNTADYTGNGNAGSYPLSTWTRKSWGYVGGNNISFLRWNIRANATYTGPYIRVRYPMAGVVGDHATYKPPLELADTVALTAQPVAGDSLALADAIVKAISPSVSDLLSLADALSKTPALVVASPAFSLSEALQAAFGKALSDLLSLGDAITQAFHRVLPAPALFGFARFDESQFDGVDGEVITLSDALSCLKTWGVLGEDVLALADAWSHLMSGVNADTSNVTDSAVAAVTKAISGTLSLSESQAFAVSKALSDALSGADALIAAVGTMLADSLSVSDAWTVGWFLADTLGLSVEQFWAQVTKIASDVSGVADAVALLAGLARADTLMLADSKTLAVIRSVGDALALAEAMHANISLVRDTVLAVTDAYWTDVRAARAETVGLAELLGKHVTADLHGDVTGLLDEAAIAALVRRSDATQLSDWAQGVAYRVLSQAFIAGTSVLTTGLTVQQSASNRVSRCAFRVPNPNLELIELARQRADVHVYLTDGQTTDYFGGVIVSNTRRAITPLANELIIEAHDYGSLAQSILVNQAYVVGTKYTDIVRQMWTEFWPYDLDLSGVQDDARTTPEAWRVINEWLFDATERITQLLGWAWRVEWNGGTKILRCFSPQALLWHRALSQTNQNIIARTAEFSDDDEIVNRVRVIGGEGLSEPVALSFVADGSQTHFMLPYYPHNPSDGAICPVTVAGVSRVAAEDSPYWPAGAEVLLNRESRFIRFQDENRPTQGQTVTVHLRYGYPIVAEVWDQRSIDRFGRHEEVLNDSKIKSTVQARERARARLRDRAWPAACGTLETTEEGLSPGVFVPVHLPDRGVNGTYEVVEIEKRVERTILRRRVTLNRTADPAARIAQRLKDFRLRLEALESKDAPSNPVVQRFPYAVEPVRVVASASHLGEITYDLAGTLSVGESHVRALSSGTGRFAWVVEWREDMADAVALLAQKAAADSLAPKELLKVGKALFGYAVFGVSEFGQEVAGS